MLLHQARIGHMAKEKICFIRLAISYAITDPTSFTGSQENLRLSQPGYLCYNCSSQRVNT